MNSTQLRPRAGGAEAGGAQAIATANAPADSPAVPHSQAAAAALPRARGLSGTAAASSPSGVATSAAATAARRAGEGHEERQDGDKPADRDGKGDREGKGALRGTPASRS